MILLDLTLNVPDQSTDHTGRGKELLCLCRVLLLMKLAREGVRFHILGT